MQLDPEIRARLPRTFGPRAERTDAQLGSVVPRRAALHSRAARLAGAPPRPLIRRSYSSLSSNSRLAWICPPWDLSSPRVSINDTSILVRSPYYPHWRASVQKIFEKIDAGVHQGRRADFANRLLVCTLPAGLPLPSGPIWPRFETQGRWVTLDAPLGTMLDPLVDAVAARKTRPETEPVERPGPLNTIAHSHR